MSWRDELREVAEDQPRFFVGCGSHVGFSKSDWGIFQMIDHLETMIRLEILLSPTESGCVPKQG